MLRRFGAPGAVKATRRMAVATAARPAPTASGLDVDGLASAFWRDGVVCVPRYLDDATVDALRERMSRYIADEAAARRAAATAEEKVEFSTTTKSHAASTYFATSGDKVRFFLEAGCSDLGVSEATVNKVGHGLHIDGDLFQRFCARPDFGALCRRVVGMRHPTAIQSMYILKPPKVGGVVVPHVDSTWLHTTPVSVVGLWFALDDCDVNNSCLRVRKGSHWDPVTARCRLDAGSTTTTTTHGTLPTDDVDALEPLECPKGSLVMFGGQTVHASGPNLSTKSRHAFVFHVVDDACRWDEDNWISPTVGRLAL